MDPTGQRFLRTLTSKRARRFEVIGLSKGGLMRVNGSAPHLLAEPTFHVGCDQQPVIAPALETHERLARVGPAPIEHQHAAERVPVQHRRNAVGVLSGVARRVHVGAHPNHDEASGEISEGHSA